MPPNGIRKLHWGPVSPTALIRQLEHCAAAIALWPSPVNADACFAAAGFHEFDDPDDLWDTQWKKIITRTLDELTKAGTPTIRQEAELYETDPAARLLRRAISVLLFQPRPTRQVHPPALDQILAVTSDCDHTEILLAFGTGALLHAGAGHPILWIGWTSPNPDIHPLIHQVAAGLPITQTTLDWPKLLPRRTKDQISARRIRHIT